MTTAGTIPDSLADFSCTNCKKTFTPDNDLAQAGLMVCPRCSAVYPVRSQLHDPDRGHSTGGKRQSKSLGQLAPPAGFEVVSSDADKLVLSCKWDRADLTWWVPIFIALLCAVGFVTFLSIGRLDETSIQLTLAGVWLVALPLGIMTGLSTYRVVAAKINRSTITVTKDGISVRRGPLPGGHPCDVSASGLQQLFCAQKSRLIPGAPPHYTYDVYCAITNADKGPQRIRLMRRLPRPEHALFLEQQIEGFLEIQDRRVGAEILA